MAKIFRMRLEDMQPSQLYISFEKLCEVMKRFNPRDPGSIEPIPVKKLGDDIIFVDGHTRAFAAFLCGVSEISVYWEDEELDWEAYRICVEWCRESGIRRISDLKNRVIPQKDYEILWYKRCEDMQRDLEKKRLQAARFKPVD
ncbi:MAG: ParB/Srx family N-terminal domain-containing protein [Thermoproteota archaeon]